VLGVLVYNSSDIQIRTSESAKLSDLDFVAVALFVTSAVPLLVGLSLAGSLYKWTEWQVVASIALGSIALLLLLGKEFMPNAAQMLFRGRPNPTKPLLGLRLLRGLHGVATFGGAMYLGVLVSRLPDCVTTLPNLM
jgi:glucose uptake protein GlcU